MQWKYVDSSAISRVAYDNGEIYIDWKAEGGSDVYAYRAPESVYDQLLSAASIGRFANQTVKRYPARHVGILR